jgi:hypothetical protein
MITIKDAMRTWPGMYLLNRETNRLENRSTKVVARPMPMPLMPEVVTASTGHSPKTSLKGGMVFHRPLVNSYWSDIRRSPF